MAATLAASSSGAGRAAYPAARAERWETLPGCGGFSAWLESWLLCEASLLQCSSTRAEEMRRCRSERAYGQRSSLRKREKVRCPEEGGYKKAPAEMRAAGTGWENFGARAAVGRDSTSDCLQDRASSAFQTGPALPSDLSAPLFPPFRGCDHTLHSGHAGMITLHAGSSGARSGSGAACHQRRKKDAEPSAPH